MLSFYILISLNNTMANNCFVLNSKGLFGFGSNLCGQLGFGMNIRCRCEPTLLMEDLDVKQIATGPHHTLMLKNNGELFVFGANYYGQLGLGHHKSVDKPILLMTDPDIKSIHCGNDHSMILKNNGELFVFGNNKLGQLGLSNIGHITIPTLLMKDSKIKSVYGGYEFTKILKNNGELFVCGDNNYGALGLDNNVSVNIPTLLMTNSTIKIYGCDDEIMEWSHIHHKFYSLDFKNRIYTFVLFLKRNQMKTGLKIPKFVLFEIIKFV